ncbi:MAG: WYL domain-containing protein [Flavobacteriales bacterium]|jgi:predicted DNA-binding transcriptional regulator YafY|nr:WYL domain-containing protein [Flavobacteriales bacterium]
MAVNKSAFQRYRIIDRCIRNSARPFPSKEELRQACEEELFGTDAVHICDSTIEKDLRYMRVEHDAPICYSRLEKGYYYSEENYSLDQMPLSDTDVDAIKVAANILSQFKHTSLFSQFEAAIDKIVNRVTIAKDVQDVAIDKFVQFETAHSIEGNEHLEKILEAIKTNRVVQFGYQSFQSKVAKIRRVHPYLLKEYRNRWYLIGKSELKDKMLTFGLDRVYDLELLSLKFKRASDFSADRFFKHAIGITTSDQLPVNLKIATNEVLSKYLLSQPLHHSQEFVGEENGSYIFTYHLLLTYELRMQLLSFGEEVLVLEPQELINEIKTVAQKVVNQY